MFCPSVYLILYFALIIFPRRRRKPKLLTRPVNLDQSLKQPLMNVADGVSSSQAPAGAFYNCGPTITGTICANNGALSMSPPGYTQLVGMPPTGVTYHNGSQVSLFSTYFYFVKSLERVLGSRGATRRICNYMHGLLGYIWTLEMRNRFTRGRSFHPGYNLPSVVD